jgi:divalent metal cation (Fe/Co/Zn/Cd) transporter
LESHGSILFCHYFNDSYIDGFASVVIGLILVGVAFYLAYESNGLLIGERARAGVVRRIYDIAKSDPSVKKVYRAMTLHFGPEQVLLAMDIEFQPDLKSSDLISAISRIEKEIRKKISIISHIFIKAGSLKESENKGKKRG